MSSLFFPVTSPDPDGGMRRWIPGRFGMSESQKKSLVDALNPFSKRESLPAATASPQPCAVESSLSAYAGKIAAEQEIRDMGIEIPAHDPATCWWCQNPQSETEVHHMMEHK